MTHIQTLKEAKKEFKEKFPYLTCIPDVEEQEDVWKWFESTLSELTESMIPEEKTQSWISAVFEEDPKGYYNLGWDDCIYEIKARRDKIKE